MTTQTPQPERRVFLDLSEHQADMIFAALNNYAVTLQEWGPEYAQDIEFIEDLVQLIEEADPTEEEAGGEIFSDELLAAMEQYPGQWVAVRDGELVAHAETLKILMENLEETAAPEAPTVLKVPEVEQGWETGLP